jgi:hypothetical protein
VPKFQEVGVPNPVQGRHVLSVKACQLPGEGHTRGGTCACARLTL